MFSFRNNEKIPAERNFPNQSGVLGGVPLGEGVTEATMDPIAFGSRVTGYIGAVARGIPPPLIKNF